MNVFSLFSDVPAGPEGETESERKDRLEANNSGVSSATFTVLGVIVAVLYTIFQFWPRNAPPTH
jgi:hypothetical protein